MSGSAAAWRRRTSATGAAGMTHLPVRKADPGEVVPTGASSSAIIGGIGANCNETMGCRAPHLPPPPRVPQRRRVPASSPSTAWCSLRDFLAGGAFSPSRRGLDEHLLEPLQAFGPAPFVQGQARLRGELTLSEKKLGPPVQLLERQLHNRLAMIRSWRIPSKRVRQTGRRIDLAELSREAEAIAIRRLHRDEVAAADAWIELDAGSSEPLGAPPVRKLSWFGQGAVDRRRRGGQHAPQAHR